MKFIIDNREKRFGVDSIMNAYKFIDYQFQKLAIGDYIVNDAIIFERKHIDGSFVFN